ncbi:MAG: TraX family protein [Suilimivivens sp.]
MQEKRGLSGSTLKIIAMISMLIDHIAYVLVAPVFYENGIEGTLYTVYKIMRGIGRLAFPIYCFLLVEGFQRTHDRKKYALRLFLFSLISEVPFDLAFYHTSFDVKHSNVLFTLLLSFLVVSLMEESKKHLKNLWLTMGTWIVIVIAAAAVAELIQCDYGAKGIAAVVLLYLFRKNKTEQLLAGCVAFSWEIEALPAFLPIAFYNGKRGIKLKYVFYIFYPAHLLLLFLIYGLVW